MIDLLQQVPPLVLFSVLLGVLSVGMLQIFAMFHQKDKRDDGQDLQIFEIKMLGIKHSGWPDTVLLDAVKDAYERRSAGTPSLMERFFDRGGS